MKMIGALIGALALLTTANAFAEDPAIAKACLDKGLHKDVQRVVDNGPMGKGGIHLLLIRQPKFVSLQSGVLTCSGVGFFSNFDERPMKFGAKMIDDELFAWFDSTDESNKPAAKPKTSSNSPRR